jgi:hypothetical protein
LEFWLSLDLSAWWSFLARMMASSIAMHPTLSQIWCHGVRCIATNCNIANYLSFPSWFCVHSMSNGVLREMFKLGMCCWHTIQSQVLENLWWLEGPLAWSAPVWCSANLERQKASRLINKSFCCYVPPWLILALACWNMELGTTSKNRVHHLETDRAKPQTNTLGLGSSALSRSELFYPQRCGTNFQNCVRCGTPPFLVSQPALQLLASHGLARIPRLSSHHQSEPQPVNPHSNLPKYISPLSFDKTSPCSNFWCFSKICNRQNQVLSSQTKFWTCMCFILC